MSDDMRWLLIYAIVFIGALAIVAWVISFSIRSALDYREKKYEAGRPRIRAQSMNYREP